MEVSIFYRRNVTWNRKARLPHQPLCPVVLFLCCLRGPPVGSEFCRTFFYDVLESGYPHLLCRGRGRGDCGHWGHSEFGLSSLASSPKKFSANRGPPAVITYPAQATFKFGDGRTGEVCHAADSIVGVAGIKGKFAAFCLGF